MKKILEGSRAIAETIKNIGVGVVSAYPITPQTHIVEDLAKMKADGEVNFEYVLAESEFAAASVVQGALLTGVRSYTATSAQGLLLMYEVLYSIAGMRLPLVITDANRTISAPINIWNDQQDIMTLRDAGWIMLFGEDNQEVCDLHILAYRIAEQLSLPVVVSIDGFVLTHVVEPVEIESSEKIKKYLPAYRPKEYLNPKEPMTFGAFATPAHYFEIRQELFEDLVASKKVIATEMQNFTNHFGRKLKLVDYTGPKNPESVVVAMGSVLGTIREAFEGDNKTGILKISCLRPLPATDILKYIKDAKNIIVIDKATSLGEEGVLSGEVKRILYGKTKASVTSCIMGLGGRDITKDMVKKTLSVSFKGKVNFIGK